MSKVRSIPALIIGAVLLAGCAAPVASPSESAVAVEDPTPVPTAMAATPTAVAETGAPAETGGPAGDSVPFFAGSVVKTVADEGLRVRSEPGTGDDSFKFEPLLPVGTPLLLLDGPVSGSGYEWYEVAPLSEPTLPRGWVASGSRQGEPWVVPAEFECPPAPTDMRSLVDMGSAVGVSCFPNEPIRVKARLISCGCDVDGPWFTPSWFSNGGGDLLLEPNRTKPSEDYRSHINLSLDPAGVHPAELPLGKLVEVTGVFDHPAASGCTLTDMDAEPVPNNGCRFQFAVTRLAIDE